LVACLHGSSTLPGSTKQSRKAGVAFVRVQRFFAGLHKTIPQSGSSFCESPAFFLQGSTKQSRKAGVAFVRVQRFFAGLHKTVLSVSFEREGETCTKKCFALKTHTPTHTKTMFDFEKLEVYSKAKKFNKSVTQFLESSKEDKTTKDQLRRASFSIMLNIAEGSGRFTKPDRRNFYVIARGSVFECVAIFDYLNDIDSIDEAAFKQFYLDLEELSKMLFALIKGLSNNGEK